MRAMVLAAGRGERLRPLTDSRPKPLAEVGGEPLLAHQLRRLAAAEVSDVVINLHHLGEQIVDAFGDGSDLGLRIRYSIEDTLLETGGGIVRALPLLGPEPFLLMNGDIYTDFPLGELPAALPEASLAHLVLTPRPPFRERGDFQLEHGRVTRRGDDYVYCGLALLDPAAFTGRQPIPFSLREVLFDLMARGALTGQVWEGYWNDIGTPEQLAAANARHRASTC